MKAERKKALEAQQVKLQASLKDPALWEATGETTGVLFNGKGENEGLTVELVETKETTKNGVTNPAYSLREIRYSTDPDKRESVLSRVVADNVHIEDNDGAWALLIDYVNGKRSDHGSKGVAREMREAGILTPLTVIDGNRFTRKTEETESKVKTAKAEGMAEGEIAGLVGSFVMMGTPKTTDAMSKARAKYIKVFPLKGEVFDAAAERYLNA